MTAKQFWFVLAQSNSWAGVSRAQPRLQAAGCRLEAGLRYFGLSSVFCGHANIDAQEGPRQSLVAPLPMSSWLQIHHCCDVKKDICLSFLLNDDNFQ